MHNVLATHCYAPGNGNLWNHRDAYVKWQNAVELTFFEPVENAVEILWKQV